MMRLFISLFTLLPFFLFATIPYFTPPKGWQDADPKSLAPLVKMGYFGKANSFFQPSVNIAAEEVGKISQKEYLKIVKKLHKSNPNCKWKSLGSFTTNAGKAELTEITTSSKAGAVKVLQLVFVKNQMAYIMSAAALEKEFSLYRDLFIGAFHSFTLAEDLFENIASKQEKKKLEETMEETLNFCLSPDVSPDKKKDKILSFHNYLTRNFDEMGNYWHYLVLKQLEEKASARIKKSL